jgi:superfamily II DNA or RNA helicase
VEAQDVKLRDYQREAKRECMRALEHNRSALVAMPTGSGKTVTFADLVRTGVEHGRRILVLAHREELLDQAAEKIALVAGCPVAIEQGSRKEAGSDDPVVIASVFSMIRRLDRFPPDAFDLVIVDEAHRSLAQTYRDLLEHFAGAKILGFTATPNRGDEKALAQVFDVVAYDMTIGDAIGLGWLVPIKSRSIKLRSLDLSKVRKRQGELAAGELGTVMSEIAVLREAIEPAVEIAAEMQAIVFTVTRAHMHCVAETVRRVAEERAIELPIACVDGTTPKDERRKIMSDFRARKIRWLINVEVATEGFDAPAVEAVIFLRPTLSRALYLQMGGRATRPLPGVVDGVGTPTVRRSEIASSAKTHCLWLDFTDNGSRHDLASPMDLLGGDYDLPEQREAERLLAAGKADDLMTALEMARAARSALLVEACARAGDPIALFGLTCSKDRWGRPPTPKQIAALGPMPRRLDFREANAVLSEMSRRRRVGLALYEQLAVIARTKVRHPIEPLRTMTRREASALVRTLAIRYWFADCGWDRIYDLAGLVRPGS